MPVRPSVVVPIVPVAEIATSGVPTAFTSAALYSYLYVRLTTSPFTIFEFVSVSLSFFSASVAVPVRPVVAPTSTDGTPVIDVTLSVLAVILALS